MATHGHSHGFSKGDSGIDLVAKVRGEERDRYCAIQAKFYQPGRPLRKADIDSFITASVNPVFSCRVLIDTTGKDYGRPIRQTIAALEKPFTSVRLSDLERSSIDWASIPTQGKLRAEDARQSEPIEAWPHQKDAVQQVRKGLLDTDRGQIIMACGTGKTYTAQLLSLIHI